ncbi:hypothetical protein HAV_00856 [Candidatus Hepatincola sp. Av]
MRIAILLILLGELLLTGCAFFQDDQTSYTPVVNEKQDYIDWVELKKQRKIDEENTIQDYINSQTWGEIEENDTFFSSTLGTSQEITDDLADRVKFETLLYFVDKNNCDTGTLAFLDMDIVIYNKRSLYSDYIDVLKVNNKNVKFSSSGYTYIGMELAKPTSYKGKKYLEDQFLYKKRVIIKDLKGEVISTYNAKGFSKMRRAMIKACKINNKNINNAL